jgi:hypothetical protein
MVPAVSSNLIPAALDEQSQRAGLERIRGAYRIFQARASGTFIRSIDENHPAHLRLGRGKLKGNGFMMGIDE